jgi:Leucine-rich repeat (LRR) protein
MAALLCLFLAASAQESGPCAPYDRVVECSVLVELAHSLNYTHWDRRARWLSSESFCSWQGVECDRSGHVKGIRLQQNSVRGEFPDLHALTHLEQLVVSHNEIEGPLPSLARLRRLVSVRLADNKLSGELGSVLPPLLQTLDLRSNQLTGTLPDLSTAPRLFEVNLADNHFEGGLPALPHGLRELYLEHNLLRGELPQLLPPHLEFLRIAFNNMTGALPVRLPSTLQTFAANHNWFSGALPNLQGLAELKRFLVQNNRLTGLVPRMLPPAMDFFQVQNNLLGISAGACAAASRMKSCVAGPQVGSARGLRG